MNLKIIGLIGMIAILLGGCSGVEPTPESKMVRKIQDGGNAGCKFLGHETASNAMGSSIIDKVSGANTKMRNIVAAAGGNAYVPTSEASTTGYTKIEFDMYKCPN